MPSTSPTVAGFRTAFRHPSLMFAEIAWRWSVGAVAVGGLSFFLIEYLDSLTVTNPDLILLSSGKWTLITRALKDIFHGSMNRAVRAAALGMLALSLLWIVTASLGRLATVRALLEVTRREIPGKIDALVNPRPMGALIQLNCLRGVLALAIALAIVGSAIVSSFVSTAHHPHPGVAVIAFLAFAVLICFAGWSLNWWLSLAQIFAVRNRQSAIASIGESVALVRERPWRFWAVSFWTGMAHLVAFSVLASAVSFPLILIGLAPRAAMAGVIFVTLVYLAVVDWLSMARLAGYVFVAEMPEALLAMPPRTPSIAPKGIFAGTTVIDRDETILSDLPNLALES